MGLKSSLLVVALLAMGLLTDAGKNGELHRAKLSKFYEKYAATRDELIVVDDQDRYGLPVGTQLRRNIKTGLAQLPEVSNSFTYKEYRKLYFSHQEEYCAPMDIESKSRRNWCNLKQLKKRDSCCTGYCKCNQLGFKCRCKLTDDEPSTSSRTSSSSSSFASSSSSSAAAASAATAGSSATSGQHHSHHKPSSP